MAMSFEHCNPLEEYLSRLGKRLPFIFKQSSSLAERSSSTAEHSPTVEECSSAVKEYSSGLEERSPVFGECSARFKECSSSLEKWAKRFCTIPQVLRNVPQSLGNAPQVPRNDETAWGNADNSYPGMDCRNPEGASKLALTSEASFAFPICRSKQALTLQYSNSHYGSNAVIPAWTAGQIGRIADLHGSAARRVRDKDVPNASRATDGNLSVHKCLIKHDWQILVSRPCDWIPASRQE